MGKLIKIGLTGCIGMGKSTTLKMFEDEGVLTWSADEAVSRLYAKDGKAVLKVQALTPESVVNNSVSREKLREQVKNRPEILLSLELIVNPLIKTDRENFLRSNSQKKAVVLDLPLLFENKMELEFDIIVVVSAPARVQKERVLSRNTMDIKLLNIIKSKQISDEEKKSRADFVFETTSIERTKKDVKEFLKEVGISNA
ncbi:MAG: dephospho-CoA kinase [Paracoccaceae bacterium]|jgi:dephospho-CoA kinase|nr:dephospho-CoA kinase [Paracoccaceae bacterium]MDC1439692.1 dephospho-CoA kinase [bacterium]MDG2372745.1 dephospho-CoA kinase [Paracoccaceae bacterium]|tara:strand:+ start:1387 stop:1983 length:597 start_codon:yes stop_codon:yes gene_type:complete